MKPLAVLEQNGFNVDQGTGKLIAETEGDNNLREEVLFVYI